MPATRRSTRQLATPTGKPSLANRQLPTPGDDDSSRRAASTSAAPSAAAAAPSNRLSFKSTRRPRSTPAGAKPQVSLPPTPKSPSSVLPLAPPAVDAGLPTSSSSAAAQASSSSATPSTCGSCTSTTIPPVLSFSFDDARQHLISADPRFAALFAAHTVGPYENLAPVDVWRSLVSSLLGQQISWLAARSIQHRFIRLFFPALLPEKHDPLTSETYKHLFPSPEQVLALAGDQIAVLKGAGLSTRKAEYVIGLSKSFADGTLSVARLMAATDDEVHELLIAIRGIGPWTVQMFQMFSLHRPNILPCGDLGVQKGLLKWTVQMHDPKTPLSFAPPAPVTPHSLPLVANPSSVTGAPPNYPPAFGMSTPVSPSTTTSHLPPHLTAPLPSNQTSPIPPAALFPALPVYAPRPLPDGLTLDLLKSRLAGKKTKAGSYLTPQEMDALTESWAPYRSVGVWFMWKVCGED